MSSLDKTGGELSLSKLLATLTAAQHEPTYVFITLPADTPDLPPLSDIRCLFRETEGITLVLPLEVATSKGYDYSFESKMITLDVHSSLEAVGFMATVSTRLAAKGIPTNPVSGFYHDHLFIPVDRAEEAMRVLETIAKENQ